MPKLFTSESVSFGHPDKLADSISDSILDAILSKDPESRVAVETLVSGNKVFIAGEYRSSFAPDFEAIARQRILDVGYDDIRKSFDGKTCEVVVAVNAQSPDIAQGVENSFEKRTSKNITAYDELGAGDQGLVFGGAVSGNAQYLPTAILLSHQIIRKLESLHVNGEAGLLYPDSKTQVTIAYEGDNPVGIDTVVLSTQHAEEAELEWIREFVLENVILPTIDEHNKERLTLGKDALDHSKTRYLINPTGRFVIGGPLGDAGLTGRKIIVDTYGGYFRHGGGAFSGKDYTKVDRSAAYAARWVAKNLVAAGYADKIEIQIAYAIGVARPVSISIDSFGTGVIEDHQIASIADKVFDLRPLAIRDSLRLSEQKYLPTSTGGHFGRTPNGESFSWEELSQVETLRNLLEEFGS